MNDRDQRDLLIILLAAGAVLGWTLIARGDISRDGAFLPILSVNDLSRWATVYSLAERGTYDIDETPFPMTIDRVRLNGHFYSSKPPLLPTLLAGEYLALKTLSFGRLSFARNAGAVIRIIVLTVNLVPFMVFLVLFARLLDKLTSDHWARTYSLAAGAFGTYLTAFNITLNNHTIAAYSAFFALYAAYRIWCEGQTSARLFAVCGFFAAFGAVNEFPATSLLGVLLAGLLWKHRRRTLVYFLPLALIPIAAHFWTNFKVTGSLAPAYASKEAYDFPGSYWKLHPVTRRLVSSRIDPATGQVVFHDNIDGQYEPWPKYLFHMLAGHHGVFSLSPIFVFSAIGAARLVRDRGHKLRAFALIAIFLTLVILTFYTFFAGQRNYGGATSGLRWVFWLIPLWLFCLPAGLRQAATSRRVRGWALACLFISAMSVFYATRNPWVRPWLHEWMVYMGWIKY